MAKSTYGQRAALRVQWMVIYDPRDPHIIYINPIEEESDELQAA